MTMTRCIAISCVALSFAALGHASDSYVLWDKVDSVVAVYEMPLEKLEQRLLQKLPELPDLLPTKTKVELATMPEANRTESVLNAPPGIIAKEALLAWMPDPKKMSSIKGEWSKDVIRRSTVFLTIGRSQSNPSRSFLIIAREWSVRGGSSVPRTSIRLPFKMWTRWPQLLKSDAEFVESLSDGVRVTLIEAGSIFDERLYMALGMQQGTADVGQKHHD